MCKGGFCENGARDAGRGLRDTILPHLIAVLTKVTWGFEVSELTVTPDKVPLEELLAWTRPATFLNAGRQISTGGPEQAAVQAVAWKQNSRPPYELLLMKLCNYLWHATRIVESVCLKVE